MTQVFFATLNQIIALFLFIALGYVLAKKKWIQEQAAGVLSKLETMIFLPAVVLQSVVKDFSTDKILSVGTSFLVSTVAILIVIPCAILLAKLFTKDGDLRKLYTYGFAFANYGYMGNAIVLAMYPKYFFEYVIATFPLTIVVYLWALPTLLIPSDGGKIGWKNRIKSFVNPMIISLLIGIVLGLIRFEFPTWLGNTISSAASCMSPVAMLLTGITVAKVDLRKTFTTMSMYSVSFVRLVVIPLIFVGVLYLLKLPENVVICIMCSIALPLGLNPLIIPAAYGKDTSAAAGLIIISHLLGCITIPIIFVVVKAVLL